MSSRPDKRRGQNNNNNNNNSGNQNGGIENNRRIRQNPLPRNHMKPRVRADTVPEEEEKRLDNKKKFRENVQLKVYKDNRCTIKKKVVLRAKEMTFTALSSEAVFMDQWRC